MFLNMLVKHPLHRTKKRTHASLTYSLSLPRALGALKRASHDHLGKTISTLSHDGKKTSIQPQKDNKLFLSLPIYGGSEGRNLYSSLLRDIATCSGLTAAAPLLVLESEKYRLRDGNGTPEAGSPMCLRLLQRAVFSFREKRIYRRLRGKSRRSRGHFAAGVDRLREKIEKSSRGRVNNCPLIGSFGRV